MIAERTPVELALGDDQALLRETAAKFIEGVCPLTQVRALAESEDGVDADYLRQAAELGWFAMLVPEEFGGGSISGESVRDLAIVAEERGRGLQPGPFVPMNVVAAALARAGTPAQQADVLPALAGGETIATWAVAGSAGEFDPGSAVEAAPDGDGWVLRGEAGLVQDGGLADWFLVTASAPQGLTQFLVPASTDGVTVRRLASLDITQRFASVELTDVHVDAATLVGGPGTAADDVEHQLQVALVLSVAESVGAMDVLFEMARQYAVDRVAFGRPIGSFQAVKHQLADMSMGLEGAKAISVAATRAVQAGTDDAGETASMAKAWVGDTGVDLAQGCFQVFAGIGYTWEHDSHLFLRRLTLNSLLFGDPDWHRERICRIHGLDQEK
jgi:alkylation response protein AidB-like acyl-CoA dehydrogenase